MASTWKGYSALDGLMEQVISDLLSPTEAALKELGLMVVTDARQRAPVRKAFKNESSKTKAKYRTLKGTELAEFKAAAKAKGIPTSTLGRGRFEVMVRRRATEQTRVDRRLRILGYNKPSKNGSIFVGNAKRTSSVIGEGDWRKARPNRSGQAAATKTIHGFAYNNAGTQSRLTSRARYNLSRGIGVTEQPSVKHPGNTDIVYGGTLRDSIYADDPFVRGRSVVVEVHASAPYAKYVEYGTYKDRAQPFLLPALMGTKRKVNATLQKYLDAKGIATRKR